MPRHIIFDLDGTLVDSLPGIEFSLRAAIAEVLPGRVCPPLRKLIGPPLGQMVRMALPNATAEQAERIIKVFRISYNALGWQHTTAYDGAKQLLAALNERHIVCHVVTNKVLAPTTSILKRLALAEELRRIVSPDSQTPVLPSKSDSLAHLIQSEGIEPASAWLVGDSREDAAAARDHGVHFVAALYGYGGVQIGAGESTVASLPEVLKLVDSA